MNNLTDEEIHPLREIIKQQAAEIARLRDALAALINYKAYTSTDIMKTALTVNAIKEELK